MEGGWCNDQPRRIRPRPYFQNPRVPGHPVDSIASDEAMKIDREEDGADHTLVCCGQSGAAEEGVRRTMAVQVAPLPWKSWEESLGEAFTVCEMLLLLPLY